MVDTKRYCSPPTPKAVLPSGRKNLVLPSLPPSPHPSTGSGVLPLEDTTLYCSPSHAAQSYNLILCPHQSSASPWWTEPCTASPQPPGQCCTMYFSTSPSGVELHPGGRNQVLHCITPAPCAVQSFGGPNVVECLPKTQIALVPVYTTLYCAPPTPWAVLPPRGTQNDIAPPIPRQCCNLVDITVLHLPIPWPVYCTQHHTCSPIPRAVLLHGGHNPKLQPPYCRTVLPPSGHNPELDSRTLGSASPWWTQTGSALLAPLQGHCLLDTPDTATSPISQAVLPPGGQNPIQHPSSPPIPRSAAPCCTQPGTSALHAMGSAAPWRTQPYTATPHTMDSSAF